MAANKMTQKLYNDEVEIDFYPDSHRYKKVGERCCLISVTSATGIIDKSRMLIPWAVRLDMSFIRQYLDENAGRKLTAEELYPIIDEACKQHDVKKEEAASIGSQVHDFAENFAKYKSGLTTEPPVITDDMPETVVNGINAFLDWYNKNDVEFIGAERLIYSKKHDYVGMADAIAKVNGKLTLIDYKTGKAVYNEAHYQVSGYVIGYEEEFGVEFEQSIILNFNKETGEMNEEVYLDRETLLKNAETFLSCLSIKRREKELASAFYANK